jgi:hypothetical protein
VKTKFFPKLSSSVPFLFCILVIAGIAVADEGKNYQVPFHSTDGLILLQGQLDGRAAVLLLDTGSNISFVDVHSSPIRFKGEKVSHVGMTGCIATHPRVKLGGWQTFGERFCVADLSDVAKEARTRVDGFVGEDILREFSSVRIDYKARVVELER